MKKQCAPVVLTVQDNGHWLF